MVMQAPSAINSHTGLPWNVKIDSAFGYVPTLWVCVLFVALFFFTGCGPPASKLPVQGSKMVDTYSHHLRFGGGYRMVWVLLGKSERLEPESLYHAPRPHSLQSP
ncbi:hypothetical protein FRB97_004025 [Tulasnella sp. 331]|nr:hypothetical protein FRB97_004025 [Tulasnella sp. 331]